MYFLGTPWAQQQFHYFFKIWHVFWDEKTLLSKELSPNDLFIFQVREYICDIAMASLNWWWLVGDLWLGKSKSFSRNVSLIVGWDIWKMSSWNMNLNCLKEKKPPPYKMYFRVKLCKLVQMFLRVESFPHFQFLELRILSGGSNNCLGHTYFYRIVFPLQFMSIFLPPHLFAK